MYGLEYPLHEFYLEGNGYTPVDQTNIHIYWSNDPTFHQQAFHIYHKLQTSFELISQISPLPNNPTESVFSEHLPKRTIVIVSNSVSPFLTQQLLLAAHHDLYLKHVQKLQI